jgi:predicted Ser/Thr protein kinase
MDRMHDTTLERLLTGRALAGRYRIGDPIGRGGMSTVFLATDERLGRQVALKVMSLPARTAEERARHRERFRREAASAAQIPPHPNLVQVYDYGTDSELDLDFLVMEWLRGHDLKEVMAGGGLQPHEARRVLLEAARGLAAGHRTGIVHRDVKPANLFLVGTDSIETVKVLDFGIAKAVEEVGEELTQAGMQPHSPAYASPEQLRGDTPITPASDVFQLALVGYELLSRHRARPAVPTPAGPEAGAGADVRAGLRWPDAGDPVVPVFERALDPEPGRRHADGAGFAEALSACWSEPTAAAASHDPASLGGDDEYTLMDPAAPGGEAARGVPVTPPPASTRRAWTLPPGVGSRLLPAGAVALAIVVLAVGLLARGERGLPGGGAVPPEIAALDEEFRPLYSTAAEALQAEASPREGAEAAEAVRQVVLDLYHSLVLGDLDRHVAHYGRRVDFHGRRNTRPSTIRREREQMIERFPDREITIERHAIEFPEPGQARALVDQRWRFAADRMQWEGEARHELRLAVRDGRWVVVAERDVEGRSWQPDR